MKYIVIITYDMIGEPEVFSREILAKNRRAAISLMLDNQLGNIVTGIISIVCYELP